MTDVFDLIIAGLVVANIAGILAYLLIARKKARREKRNIDAINAAITDYFRRSGVEVTVGCTSLRGNNRYTAVIESEPMKRFRLSHIIEMTLSDLVSKTCDLELEKVYWRFPIKEATRQMSVSGSASVSAPASTSAPASAPETVVGETKPVESTDDYINEGLEHYKYIPTLEVTELSWEKFEEVSGPDSKAGGAGTKPGK